MDMTTPSGTATSFIFDSANGDILLNGNIINTRGKKRQLLLILLQNAGEWCRTELLAEHLAPSNGSANYINVSMTQVRKLLDQVVPGSSEVVERKYNTGYRIPSEYVPDPDAWGECELRVERKEPRVFSVGTKLLTYRDGFWSVGDVPLNPKKVSPQKSEALLYLLEHRGQIVDRLALHAHLHNGKASSDNLAIKLIDVLICNLRSALKEAGADMVIESVWGQGYQVPLSSFDDAPEPPEGLPARDSRWVASRKFEVVIAIKKGTYTPEQVVVYYPGLTVETVQEWVRIVDQHGMEGLRATRAPEYSTAA